MIRRLEAPSEEAGERESIRAVVRRHIEDRYYIDNLVDELLALRARSSAPEAREEALGNLLAVIHGDGGHRALEVGTKQAALEAEKIVAGLFAAPSADKLRVAVEALEFYSFEDNYRGEPEDRFFVGSDDTAFTEMGLSPVQADEGKRARQALAALKAEGAK